MLYDHGEPSPSWLIPADIVTALTQGARCVLGLISTRTSASASFGPGRVSARRTIQDAEAVVLGGAKHSALRIAAFSHCNASIDTGREC